MLHSNAVLSMLAVGFLFPLAGHAAGDGMPPPGLYQIDMESTVLSGQNISVTTKRDGATGRETTTRRVGADEQVDQQKGSGPVRVCVAALNTPPAPFYCSANTAKSGLPSNGSAANGCARGPGTQVQWRRIGKEVWDVSYEIQSAAANQPGTSDLQAKMREQMLANFPPEARAALAANQGGAPTGPSSGAGQSQGSKVSAKEKWTQVAQKCVP